MATVSENLLSLQNTKNDIKQAIADKGVAMDGVAFTGYADKIGEIQTGGGVNVIEVATEADLPTDSPDGTIAIVGGA